MKPIVLKSPILILLCNMLLSLASSAQDGTIVTERPGMMFSGITVENKRLQVETGAAFVKEIAPFPRNLDVRMNDILVRYGLPWNGELRYGHSWMNLRTADGVGGSSWNTKWEPYFSYKQAILVGLNSDYKLSTVAQIHIPVQGDSGNLSAGLYFPLSYTVDKGRTLSFMPVFMMEDIGVAEITSGISLLYTHAWTNVISQFFQVYVDQPLASVPGLVPGTGFMWLADDNLQFDVSWEWGKQADREFWNMGIGLCYKFNAG